MESSTTSSTTVQTSVQRETAREIGRWWWAWLVMGILWILAAVVILQFRQSSITVVGVIIGILLLVAGIQEFAVASVAGGWRWLWAVFGVILIAGGIYSLIHPVNTFLAVASTLGFLFALIGIFWVVEAFATAAINPLWWLGLISGFILIGLGFWAGGQFLATQAYTLLIFAGVWALLHGIGDIIRAFMIRRVGKIVAEAPSMESMTQTPAAV